MFKYHGTKNIIIVYSHKGNRSEDHYMKSTFLLFAWMLQSLCLSSQIVVYAHNPNLNFPGFALPKWSMSVDNEAVRQICENVSFVSMLKLNN